MFPFHSVWVNVNEKNSNSLMIFDVVGHKWNDYFSHERPDEMSVIGVKFTG